MTHMDRGNYAKKYSNMTIDPDAKKILEEKAADGKITCASVHGAAKELGITPAEAGIQADLLELRLIRCSLGLFGHDNDTKILKSMESIPEKLDAMLDKAAVDNRISCIDCWTIAENLKLKKMDVSSACETKGLRIRPCQLGAF